MEVDTEGREGGRERRRREGPEGGSEEACASTAGPRRKILEEGTTRGIPGPKESHLGETY